MCYLRRKWLICSVFGSCPLGCRMARQQTGCTYCSLFWGQRTEPWSCGVLNAGQMLAVDDFHSWAGFRWSILTESLVQSSQLQGHPGREAGSVRVQCMVLACPTLQVLQCCPAALCCCCGAGLACWWQPQSCKHHPGGSSQSCRAGPCELPVGQS